ncbi:DNA repair protein RecO [Shewanella sp. 202IG2-18]|uniref:DNA repair protein RecO n=1 Tax=Parashewanella hymeniacidonis TaxID=2807618 RepID=UPI00195FD1C9|nr:DNA repair protein RecO [Parashewanella hymeniacidonis]MBM7072621.1 DNA repair protein RecO [Parashewanella hymeniacidonis]
MERGYILHHRPFKESSLLVNLLVDGMGRVDAVARVGSGKRSLKPILQPFQPLIFNFTGKSELKNLIQVEAASAAIPLSGEQLYASMYLNELLVRTLSNQHQAEELFHVYHRVLLDVAAGFEQHQLRWFEYQLLLQLGAMPSLLFDAQGEKISDDGLYRYIPDQGFIFVGSRTNNVISGKAINQLRDNKITEGQFLELKILMRNLLSPFLGNKPLMSRKLFAQLTKSKQT